RRAGVRDQPLLARQLEGAVVFAGEHNHCEQRVHAQALIALPQDRVVYRWTAISLLGRTGTRIVTVARVAILADDGGKGRRVHQEVEPRFHGRLPTATLFTCAFDLIGEVVLKRLEFGLAAAVPGQEFTPRVHTVGPTYGGSIRNVWPLFKAADQAAHVVLLNVIGMNAVGYA